MYKLILILLFTPSVTFGLTVAEVFPWALVLSLLFIRKYSIYFLVLFFIFSFSALITTYSISIYEPTLETDAIRSLGAYLNILFVTQLLLQFKDRVFAIILISRILFIFLVILGLAQYYHLPGLHEFVSALVPRGTGFALNESGRGVTLLASEPARAGVELVLIYLMYRLTIGNGLRINYLIDFFLLCFILLIIKSASAFIFYLGVLCILYFNIDFLRRHILLFSVLPILIIVSVFYIVKFDTGRASILLLDIYTLNDLSSIMYFIANESSNRVIALYSFFVSGFTHPFGYGVGSWPFSSILAFNETGLDHTDFRFFDVHGGGNIVPFRGPGVISNLLLDVGFFGFILISFVFIRWLKSNGSFSSTSKHALLIFIFKIFLFGSPGNPIVFIFLLSVFIYHSRIIQIRSYISYGKK